MKIHYLEIVTNDLEETCNAYEAVYGISFSETDTLLGGARTFQMDDGSIVGVRAPLRDDEKPIVRPYWLVDDIDEAVQRIKEAGGFIAMVPIEIPSKGKFAIYILGGNDHGLWQLD